MIKRGRDNYGAEYERKSDDFGYQILFADNCACSICHGTGARIDFEYVIRDYKGKDGNICKKLQTHRRNFWICPECIENLMHATKGLVKRLDAIEEIKNLMHPSKDLMKRMEEQNND